jgi:hypothetical protein
VDQRRTITPKNVHRYIELVFLQQARQAQATPSAEEEVLKLTITDVETRIHRWEDTLERGLLPLEDAAHRIKEPRAEREALLKKKTALEEVEGPAPQCDQFRPR